ncbi:hypothetical protein F5888DRAFT_678084 [Russula emetica]|nr:hypothetical protein F5888DRAFT_678084 [Russula emetica]
MRKSSGSVTTAANLGTNHQHAQSRAASQLNNAIRAVASGISKRNAQRFAYKAQTKNATIAVHFGHIARVCPNEAVQDYGFASRTPPPGRGLNMASLPPIKCYRCGGPNHMARSVLGDRRHEGRQGTRGYVLQVQGAWSHR